MHVLRCVPISIVYVKVLVSNNCYSGNRYTLPRVALLIAATLSKKRRVGRKRASPFTARAGKCLPFTQCWINGGLALNVPGIVVNILELFHPIFFFPPSTGLSWKKTSHKLFIRVGNGDFFLRNIEIKFIYIYIFFQGEI